MPRHCRRLLKVGMRNAATKKTQRNLLKQQYENFTASSSVVLDKTFDRLQKLIRQLEIHGESISQEDVNQKVKGTSSLSSNTQNVAFVSSNSTSSTNGAVNTTHGATTASTQATAVNSTIIDQQEFKKNGFKGRMAKLTIRAMSLENTGTLSRECNLQGTKKKTRIGRTQEEMIKQKKGPTNFALRHTLQQVSNSEFVNEPIVSEPTIKKPVVEISEAKASVDKPKVVRKNFGNPQQDLQEKGVIDSGCSRHMTGNMSYLIDFEKIDGGYVAFGDNPKGGKITCRVPRKNNMYSVDLKNIVPKGGLTCLFAKATSDESKLWHRRLGHINFKTMNKLVKGNLVRGLPSKLFEIDQTCVACQKGKQHRASSRTPQQNRVAERKNRTLIEAARTMLVDSKLPTNFWAEAVNIACYVQNMVLVTKPHNKTPYELFLGRKLALGFMRPFGCPAIILNMIDHLGKFGGKADEGFFVGYSINCKAFRVFNRRTMIVKENLHVQFSENTPNIAGSRPNWLFDIDALTKSLNYKPVVVGNQSNGNAGTKACDDTGKARMETVPDKDYILLPLWTADPPFFQSSKSFLRSGFKPQR
ncbi:ribonuclease H-like domain-containing protein [Tanacetum coccineum]